ncbi:site-specific integrase [Rhodococcus erythropolis]|uniref:site-specific integrase n=1 Tax=Rhodococcus erythropolis TaxID=1833 RepID=UPI001C9BAAC8|nr:site-specific integrase [Rhodococcus erythropolis]MBY6385428.1 site-specific integrase [Rhodococcus erythropolis]
MSDEFYPENLMPVASQLEVRYRRFSELREQVLLDYGYNTARAYWSDLDSICIWALERDKDPLDLTEKEIRQYVSLLRRRRYSENTIRRHVTALRKIYRQDPLRSDAENPAGKVVIRNRGQA